MAEAKRRTYRGNCHCGGFVYEAQLPEIKSVYECNCSICVKKGYLWVFAGKEDFKIVKGSDDALTTYLFGQRKLAHKFCPKCATPVMAAKMGDSQMALNVHAVQGLNTWTLERTPFDGAAVGEPYQPPAHKGSLPAAQVEGGKTYTGSCHCGALTVAAVSQPLDETAQGIVECNCSICERYASLWTYPMKEHVVLSGDEADFGEYSFGPGNSFKTFCKICGVAVANGFNEFSAEKLAYMPQKAREVFESYSMTRPINVRVLQGVDLAKLKPNRFDGATKISLPYENP